MALHDGPKDCEWKVDDETHQEEPVKEKPKYDITGFGYALGKENGKFGLIY